MIRCPQCGYKNKDGTRYCEDCGATLIKEKSPFIEAEPLDAPTLDDTTNPDPDEEGKPKNDMLCVLAFAGSVINLMACGLFGVPVLALSIAAYQKAKKTDNPGKSYALYGIILSAISIVGFMMYAAMSRKN